MIPETLTVKTRNGVQVYLPVEVKPFTRSNGTKTQVVIWESRCRECGAIFRVASGTSKERLKYGPGIVRCETHRRTPLNSGANKCAK
jgi:hypothetical protein